MSDSSTPSMGSVLTDAASGAASLSFLGPIGAAAGGLLGLATDIVPALLPHLFGSNSATVQGAVKTVLGAVAGPGATATDVKAALSANPAQATAVQVQLAQIAQQQDQAQAAARQAELASVLSDVASARAQTVDLAKAGSATAWGAPLISVLVLVSFGYVMSIALTKSLPSGSETLLTMLLGTLSASATAVVSYWVGSSAGSAQKNALLANSVPASTVSK